jgi:5-methylcytosine-specific restriction endonuclease McrA
MKQTATNETPTTQDSRPGQACTSVFVVDKNNVALMPCKPGRALVLLESKRADVYKMHPFTIRILDREDGVLQEMELKVDPGSKTTGFALMVLGAVRGWFCIAAWELWHRGQQIKNNLLARAQLRRGRRSRKTRYRAARFNNRTREVGWLPPSLQSRVNNVVAFTRKIAQVCPLTAIPVEQVRFDLQLMENPEISGVQYQQGELLGYEVREYLLLKWKHQCAYCQVKDVPLQVEHITPRSKGGTDRISNLCIACERCNQKKANRPLPEFLKGKPELLAKILRQAKAPLKDAAAVNSMRKALVSALKVFGLPVPTGSSGLTKFNRTRQKLPKAHWIDAACVGQSGAQIDLSVIRNITMIQAKGRGSRQMCCPDRFGFLRTRAKTVKRLHNFQTGDQVRLTQPSGKHQGVHDGVVSIRMSGQFDVKFGQIRITTPHSRFALLSRFDGYTYSHRSV